MGIFHGPIAIFSTKMYVWLTIDVTGPKNIHHCTQNQIKLLHSFLNFLFPKRKCLKKQNHHSVESKRQKVVNDTNSLLSKQTVKNGL